MWLNEASNKARLLRLLLRKHAAVVTVFSRFRHRERRAGSLSFCRIPVCRAFIFSAMFLSISSCSSGGGGGDSDSTTPRALDEVAIGQGSSSLRLAWEESMQREDGSPIEDSLSYRIYYSRSGQIEQAVEVGPVNTVLLLGLEPGEYSFAVSSVDSTRVESSLSEPISISVQ